MAYDIRLRAIEPEDVEVMYVWENDTGVWLYSDRIAPLSRKIISDYAVSYDADPFRAGQLRLMVERICDSCPIGILDLYEVDAINARAMVGIYITTDARHRGYARQSLSLLSEYARDTLGLHSLGAYIAEDNPDSINLFTGCGFTLVGTLSDWLRLPSRGFLSVHIMQKLLGS